MRHKAMPAGQPGELIGDVGQPALAIRGGDLVDRGDDPGRARPAAASRAQHELPRLVCRIGLAELAGFDLFAIERTAEQLGDDRAAQRVELAVAMPDDRIGIDAEHAEPRTIGGHVLELMIEDRGGGREIGHEGRNPRARRLSLKLRGGNGGSCGMLCHGARLFVRRLKNGEA